TRQSPAPPPAAVVDQNRRLYRNCVSLRAGATALMGAVHRRRHLLADGPGSADPTGDHSEPRVAQHAAANRTRTMTLLKGPLRKWAHFPTSTPYHPFPKPKAKASEFTDGNCCSVRYELRLLNSDLRFPELILNGLHSRRSD